MVHELRGEELAGGNQHEGHDRADEHRLSNHASDAVLATVTCIRVLVVSPLSINPVGFNLVGSSRYRLGRPAENRARSLPHPSDVVALRPGEVIGNVRLHPQRAQMQLDAHRFGQDAVLDVLLVMAPPDDHLEKRRISNQHHAVRDQKEVLLRLIVKEESQYEQNAEQGQKPQNPEVARLETQREPVRLVVDLSHERTAAPRLCGRPFSFRGAIICEQPAICVEGIRLLQ